VEFTPEQLKEWIGLGVGGLLAAMIFMFYRQDRRNSEGRLMKMEERALDVLTTNAANAQKMAGALESLGRSMEKAEESKVHYFDKILERLMKR